MIRESGIYDQTDRLTLSGSQRLALPGSTRLILYNSASPWTDPNVEVWPAIAGIPRRSRISFTVLDGWTLPILERLTLQGAIRMTLKGDARLELYDYAAKPRLVLAGVPNLNILS